MSAIVIIKPNQEIFIMEKKQSDLNEGGELQKARSMGWNDLYLKEDWWAIWGGIGLMLLAVILFNSGNHFLSALAVNPGGVKWSSLGQLADHFTPPGLTASAD